MFNDSFKKISKITVYRLTAFVMRVFCAAQKFGGISIDEDLICESVTWLVKNQRADGAFPERHDVVHKSMTVCVLF